MSSSRGDGQKADAHGAFSFINNVGTQVTTLYASSEDGATTASVISAAQAYYVTAISLSNCLGRIAFGAASEKVQTSWRINRTVWLFVAAVCLLIGQTTAKSAKSPDDLMMPSILNGMA